MKRPNIDTVNSGSELIGLTFFAQVLEELLFHHTVDSFKAPALNTVSRAFELKTLAQQAITQPNKSTKFLTPVIQELEWSIRNDPVITGETSTIAHDLLKRISGPEKSPSEIFDLTSSLQLHLTNYWPKIKDNIQKTILDGKQKQKIRALAATFTAHIELRGFSRRYAYFVTQNILLKKLSSNTKIENIETVINDFLQMFEVNGRKWTIVYRGSAEFERFKPFCSSYHMKIENSYQEPKDRVFVKRFFGKSVAFPNFIIFENIEARDCYSARETTDSLLEAFGGACKFHIHDLKLEVNQTCATIEEGSKEHVLIKPAPNPMMCGAVNRKSHELESELHKTTEILAGAHLSHNSTRMYSNALEYHKAALEAGTPENQLLDLWAAIEGFLPQPSATGNRIGHYTALLVPALMLTYPEKIFKYLSDSLYHAGTDVRDFVESQNIRGDFFAKCTCLITAEELMDARIKLLALPSMHPLLRFTIDQIYRSFNSKKTTLNTLLNHKEKVSWHIQRIYITRNIIMHSADSLPYLRTLVENLHAYLDILIPSITKLAVSSRIPLDIEAAVRLLSIHEEHFISGLRKKEEKCTIDNYSSIIFGSENPLNPFNAT